jgi:hypothetical protein
VLWVQLPPILLLWLILLFLSLLLFNYSLISLGITAVK